MHLVNQAHRGMLIMDQQINPVKLQAVKDALEFVANRSQVDMAPDQFMQLVQSIFNFYNDEFSKQSK